MLTDKASNLSEGESALAAAKAPPEAGRVKIMNKKGITSSFTIQSSGLIKGEKSIVNYKNLMSGKIRKMGIIKSINERMFSDMGFIYVWTGEIISPNDIDLVYKQFKRYNEIYLNEWVIDFKIKYREGG